MKNKDKKDTLSASGGQCETIKQKNWKSNKNINSPKVHKKMKKQLEESEETFEVEDLIVMRNIVKWGYAKPRKQLLKSVVSLLIGFISAYFLFELFFIHKSGSSSLELILVFGTFGGGACAAFFSWKLVYCRLLVAVNRKYIADLLFTLVTVIVYATIAFPIIFLKKYPVILMLLMPLLPFATLYGMVVIHLIVDDIGDLLKYIWNKIKGKRI